MSSRARRHKGKYQAPEKKNRRRLERPAPQPNAVVASQPVEAKEAIEMPAAPRAVVFPHPAPDVTKSHPIMAELKQVAILGGAIVAVLVLLAILLG